MFWKLILIFKILLCDFFTSSKFQFKITSWSKHLNFNFWSLVWFEKVESAFNGNNWLEENFMKFNKTNVFLFSREKESNIAKKCNINFIFNVGWTNFTRWMPLLITFVLNIRENVGNEDLLKSLRCKKIIPKILQKVCRKLVNS